MHGHESPKCIITLPNIYRPQRSWGKVIFSQASVFGQRGGGVVPGQVHPPVQVHPQDHVHLPNQVHPPDQVHTPWTRYTPRSIACREIRAKSRRYACYWNAFLFILPFVVNFYQVLQRIFSFIFGYINLMKSATTRYIPT